MAAAISATTSPTDFDQAGMRIDTTIDKVNQLILKSTMQIECGSPQYASIILSDDGTTIKRRAYGVHTTDEEVPLTKDGVPVEGLTSLAVEANGQFLILHDWGMTAEYYEYDDGRFVWSTDITFTQEIQEVYLRPNGDAILVCGTPDQEPITIAFFDYSSKAITQTIPLPTCPRHVQVYGDYLCWFHPERMTWWVTHWPVDGADSANAAPIVGKEYPNTLLCAVKYDTEPAKVFRVDATHVNVELFATGAPLYSYPLDITSHFSPGALQCTFLTQEIFLIVGRDFAGPKTKCMLFYDTDSAIERCEVSVWSKPTPLGVRIRGWSGCGGGVVWYAGSESTSVMISYDSDV